MDRFKALKTTALLFFSAPVLAATFCPAGPEGEPTTYVYNFNSGRYDCINMFPGPGVSTITYVVSGSTTVAAAPLPSCSGASNALTFNTSNNTYGCNTIVGGGGGASALGVGTGTASGFSGVITSSPTGTFLGNSLNMQSQLLTGTTVLMGLANTINSTHTWTAPQNLIAGITVASSATVNGTGGGIVNLLEGTTNVSASANYDILFASSNPHGMAIINNQGASGLVVISTSVPTVGHLASFSASNQLVDGGTGGGGGGTPANPVNSVQYNNTGAFGGSSNFTYTGTSTSLYVPVLIVSTVAAGQYLFTISSASLAPFTTYFSVDTYGNVKSSGSMTLQYGLTAATATITTANISSMTVSTQMSLTALTTSQVLYSSGANIVASEPAFWWDTVNKTLIINNAQTSGTFYGLTVGNNANYTMKFGNNTGGAAHTFITTNSPTMGFSASGNGASDELTVSNNGGNFNDSFSVAGKVLAGDTHTNTNTNKLDVVGGAAIGGAYNGNTAPLNGLLVYGSELVIGSFTVTSSSGASITYNVNVGSITGGGLAACGDSTHALGYNGSSLFTCQNIPGGGGGGASVLATAIGSSITWTTQIDSPTAAINLDASQFQNSVANGTTAFYTISYASLTVTGSYTMVSTNSIVYANCSSACTITLPSATYGFSLGRIYKIKIVGTGTTSITAAAGNIDGSATITPTPNQYAAIEVTSDGTNYNIQ